MASESSSGSDPSSKRAKKNRVLMRKLSLRGDVEGLKSLLRSHPEAVHYTDSNGATCVHHAAFNGHVAALKLLFKFGAKVDTLDSDGCSPLHNAAFNGQTNAIRLLVESGANPNLRDQHDESTPLHKAAFNGHTPALRALLELNADVNALDADGLSVLQKVAFNNHTECMEALFEKGGRSLVSLADGSHSTPLHKAAVNGHVDCCRILLREGANVNATDKDLVTPLHFAAFNNHIDALRLFIENQANISKSSKFGHTALHYAALNGHRDVLRVLIEAGLSPDVQDSKGLTPLHYAVKKDHPECVQVLLERKADPNIRDAKGRRPLKLRSQTPSGRRIYALLSVARDSKHRSRKSPHKAQRCAHNPNANTSPLPVGSHRKNSLDNGDLTASTPVTPIQPDAEAQTSDIDAPDFIADEIGGITDSSTSETPSQLSVLGSPASAPSPAHSTIPMSTSCTFKAMPSSPAAASSIPDGYRRDLHGFLVKSDSPMESSPVVKQSKRKRKIAVELKWAKALKKWEFSKQSNNQIVNKNLIWIRKHCERGLPDSVRGRVWRNLLRIDDLKSKNSKQGKPSFADLSVDKGTEFGAIILRDINRTFPNHFLFSQDKGQGQKSLYRILLAYSNYNPTVGYCQGMGFLVALFLMYFQEEEDAFWGLVRLLDPDGMDMATLYSQDMPKVAECSYVVGRLLKNYVPKLDAHLNDLGVDPGLYAPQLFITVFLYNMPFNLCLRIWDRFLIDGFSTLFTIAVAILKSFEDELVRLDFEAVMHFLKFDNNQEAAAEPLRLDPEEVFKIAEKLKIKQRFVLKLQQFHREQAANRKK